jgi:hypothetical protein
MLNGKPILVCDNPACIGKASQIFSKKHYGQSSTKSPAGRTVIP